MIAARWPKGLGSKLGSRFRSNPRLLLQVWVPDRASVPLRCHLLEMDGWCGDRAARFLLQHMLVRTR